MPTAPNYGDPFNLGMASLVLVMILLITRFLKGFLGNIAVLLGIVIGCAIAWYLGRMSFEKVAEAPWFALIYPFQFGFPKFEIVSIVTMCIVMIVVLIESAGMFLALGDITTVTVYAFKILDLFLIGAILYIVALGLAGLFLDAKVALPARFQIRELQDLKVILSQAVVVVLIVAFLGDVLEWERAADVAYVGGGIAMVIAAIAFMLHGARSGD